MNVTRENFERWLDRFKPHEIVGIARADCDCPLARCIRDHQPWYRVYVDAKQIKLTEPKQRYSLRQPKPIVFASEPWQQDLIYYVDELTTAAGGPVTATEVRLVYERLCSQKALEAKLDEAPAS